MQGDGGYMDSVEYGEGLGFSRCGECLGDGLLIEDPSHEDTQPLSAVVRDSLYEDI
jgi:hypothetical protein